MEVEHVSDTAKHVTDYTIGGLGATSPAWLQWLHTVSEVAATLAAIGGAVLVTFRIALVWRDWQRQAKVKIEEDS